MIAKLAKLNDKPIYGVESPEFAQYARLIVDFELKPLLDTLASQTSMPEVGNCYQPSHPALEALSIKAEIQQRIYGGMPIQMGYCNGRNQQYNGLEYHKGSELNINLGPVVMAFGKVQDIVNDSYAIGDTQLFYLEAGSMIEIYATTLHLAPMRLSDDGFKAVVVLPLGTNTPLALAKSSADGRLLLETNKWIMAHSSANRLIARGVHPGLVGDNAPLRYV